ncbi:MAG TPA: M48 family metalloprotease [Longimicrobium sp.]|nr:M48 family metalloprotease [Longimicrobium sp.]
MRRNGFVSRAISMLRAAWATIWLFGIPKDLWGLLCVWPTLFLAVASYLREPSSGGVQLIVLALVWDTQLGAWLTISAMKKGRGALLATLVRLRDCAYVPLGWSRIVGAHNADIIERSSLLELMRRQGLPYDHSQDVRFFRVDMGDSGMILGGVCVFNIPFIEAVVLVRDDEMENAPVQERFALYHELGHTLGDEFASRSALHKGVKLPLAALVLAAFAMQPAASSLRALALCLLGLSLVGLTLRRRSKNSHAMYEMRADQFAIAFLNDQEKEYVLQNAASVLPRDEKLSALEHQIRVAGLRSFIETGESFTDTHPGMSPWAFIVETQLTALNLGAWMILLSRFIGTPSPDLLYRFRWLLATLIVLSVLRYAIHYVKGLMIELIFIRRFTWQDGTFKLRRGPAWSPYDDAAAA